MDSDDLKEGTTSKDDLLGEVNLDWTQIFPEGGEASYNIQLTGRKAKGNVVFSIGCVGDEDADGGGGSGGGGGGGGGAAEEEDDYPTPAPKPVSKEDEDGYPGVAPPKPVSKEGEYPAAQPTDLAWNAQVAQVALKAKQAQEDG